MQNENAGKTVQITAEDLNPHSTHSHCYDAWQGGYTTAQQSQPMWREIEPTLYYDTRYMRNKDSAVLRSGSGWELLRDGYTHYLSSDDLLKLPTEKK